MKARTKWNGDGSDLVHRTLAGRARKLLHVARPHTNTEEIERYFYRIVVAS